MSHPSRVCGLKQVWSCSGPVRQESHPSRVCGLKLVDSNINTRRGEVTPFAGVWIETPTQILIAIGYGHTLRGCVD